MPNTLPSIDETIAEFEKKMEDMESIVGQDDGSTAYSEKYLHEMRSFITQTLTARDTALLSQAIAVVEELVMEKRDREDVLHALKALLPNEGEKKS